MDPVCKLILAVDLGDHTLVMAQRLVHQVTQVLAPECAPQLLTCCVNSSRSVLTVMNSVF